MRYAVLVMLVVLSCGNLAVVHAAEWNQRETLRGLPGVGVLVLSIEPDATADGLSEEAVQTAVELILRASGIRVLSESEQFGVPSAPRLYVNIDTIKIRGAYSLSIDLTLTQMVQLLTAGNKVVFAHTWMRSWHGDVGRNNLRQVISGVEDLVRNFANDFLAVNPRK